MLKLIAYTIMINIFDRNYEELGSSDCGLILRNSGKIKFQWGNTFIDLFDNNGKLSGISDLEARISALEEKLK